MKKKILFIAVITLLVCVIPICAGATYSDSYALDITSVEELQNEYDFKYFNSVYSAVMAINGGNVDESEDVLPEDAFVCVYTDEDGMPCVVLLEDITEEIRIVPTVNMKINLGGHTLRSNDAVAIQLTSCNLAIDGTIAGSGICVEHEDGTPAFAVKAAGSSVVTVLGGTYICSSKATYDQSMVFDLNDSSRLIISNAVISAYETNSIARGIGLRTASTSAVVSDCEVVAHSNYVFTSSYTGASQGILSNGTLILEDSYVFGNHSGVSSFGLLFVNGGTYEGYGHGGFYICGSNTTSYLQNATIRECRLPDGYTTNQTANNVAIYVGGTQKENIRVYIDSCDIQGTAGQTLTLRGTGGEKNNTVYVSNSTITGKSAKFIRIDNDTLKLYMGTGNKFKAEHTNRISSVINTYETYVPGDPLKEPALSTAKNLLIIADCDPKTEYYDIYVNGTNVGTVTSQATPIEYSMPELPAGEYVIGVIARAVGIKNSNMTTVIYTVPKFFDGYYTEEDIEASPYLYAIGNTGASYVVAKFNADYSKVTILKNGSDSDGLMTNWDFGSCITTNPMYTNRATLTSVVIDDGVVCVGDYAFYKCSELADVFYSGTQNKWDNMSIGSSNESLLDVGIHCNYPMICATKSQGTSGTKYIVELKNIPLSSSVVVALYENDRFVGMVPGTYNEETVELPTSIAHDEAKIIVFNNLNDISPLAESVEFTNR